MASSVTVQMSYSYFEPEIRYTYPVNLPASFLTCVNHANCGSKHTSHTRLLLVVLSIRKLTSIKFSMLGADCPQLSPPAHGNVEGYRREIDSAVRVSCDEGYNVYPDSSSFRTCLPNKQWSGADPICKRKNMHLLRNIYYRLIH